MKLRVTPENRDVIEMLLASHNERNRIENGIVTIYINDILGECKMPLDDIVKANLWLSSIIVRDGRYFMDPDFREYEVTEKSLCSYLRDRLLAVFFGMIFDARILKCKVRYIDETYVHSTPYIGEIVKNLDTGTAEYVSHYDEILKQHRDNIRLATTNGIVVDLISGDKDGDKEFGLTRPRIKNTNTLLNIPIWINEMQEGRELVDTPEHVVALATINNAIGRKRKEHYSKYLEFFGDVQNAIDGKAYINVHSMFHVETSYCAVRDMFLDSLTFPRCRDYRTPFTGIVIEGVDEGSLDEFDSYLLNVLSNLLPIKSYTSTTILVNPTGCPQPYPRAFETIHDVRLREIL